MASKVVEIARNSSDGQESEQVEAFLPPLRDAIEQACQRKAWKGPIRRCIVRANSAAQLEACDPQVLQQRVDGAGKEGVSL